MNEVYAFGVWVKDTDWHKTVNERTPGRAKREYLDVIAAGADGRDRAALRGVSKMNTTYVMCGLILALCLGCEPVASCDQRGHVAYLPQPSDVVVRELDGRPKTTYGVSRLRDVLVEWTNATPHAFVWDCGDAGSYLAEWPIGIGICPQEADVTVLNPASGMLSSYNIKAIAGVSEGRQANWDVPLRGKVVQVVLRIGAE